MCPLVRILHHLFTVQKWQRGRTPTRGFQPAVGQTAAVAVAAVLVGHIRGRGVRVHRGRIGVAQGAAVGRAARKGTFMLGLADTVQAVDWVVYVGQARGVLLVRRVSVAELQKGRFGGIRGIQTVRHETHRHH